MLVIRRRAGESLFIGEAIEVEVVEVSGGRVKLGIQAPRDVRIVRKEVLLSERENREAAQGGDNLAAAKMLAGYYRSIGGLERVLGTGEVESSASDR